MCACAGSPAGHHPVRAGRLLDAAARAAAHHAADVQPRHQGRVIPPSSVADPGSGAFLTPGIRDGLKIRIRDEQPGSYFRELKKKFGVKIPKFLDTYPEWKKFGSGMEKFGPGIRDKQLGSATLPPNHIFEIFSKHWYVIMSQLRTIVSHNFLRNFVKLFMMLNYCNKFRENSKLLKNLYKKRML